MVEKQKQRKSDFAKMFGFLYCIVKPRHNGVVLLYNNGDPLFFKFVLFDDQVVNGCLENLYGNCPCRFNLSFFGNCVSNFSASTSDTRYPDGGAYSPVIPFRYDGINSLHKKKEASVFWGKPLYRIPYSEA